MKIRHRTILALLAVLASLALWYGVWFMHGLITATTAESVKLASSSQGSALREAVRTRSRTLFSDTESARAGLASFVHADVINVAKVIEAVGPAAHADLKVTSVAQEQLPVPKKGLVHPLHGVSYSVEVRGTFAQVMKTAELLEQLPLPIVATQFNLSLDSGPTDKGLATWRLSETLRLFTDNDLPS